MQGGRCDERIHHDPSHFRNHRFFRRAVSRAGSWNTVMTTEIERLKRAIHEIEHRLKTEPDHAERLYLRRKYFQLTALRDDLEQELAA